MSSFTQTPHPILKPIPLAELKKYVTVNGQVDTDRVLEIHQKIKDREATLKLAEEDPLNHGFNLDHWQYAEELLSKSMDVMCLGGNRSGKTEFGARAVVRSAILNEKATIICFAQDEIVCIEVQQSAIYRNLPPEYKQKTKTETEYVNYKVKTGFSGASLILRNGSKMLFRKY